MLLRNQLLYGAICSLLLFSAADAAYAADSAVSVTSTGAVQAFSSASSKTGDLVVKIVDNTNLRKGPGLNYEIIGKAKPGEAYPVVSTAGEWHTVSLPSGGTAYVASWVVKTEQKAIPPKQTSEPEKTAVVKIVDNTNLRKGPGLGYEIVGKAKPGDSLPIIGTKADWFYVSLPGGGNAYVASWVVKTDGLVPLQQKPPAASADEGQEQDSKVYIYHTHNRESWKNVARNTKGSSFDDPEVNITLVGQQLGKQLQALGIASLVEEDDFTERLREQNLGFAQSYSQSRKAIDKAAEAQSSLVYFLDIHRDADVPRSSTAVTIGEKSYARILFVIGTANPNYEENRKFAEALHGLLNKKYPGLSRGILLKGADQGNGEYNQTVSPGSLLLEFGGVNNTLQENLYSANAFADVFAEYYESMN